MRDLSNIVRVRRLILAGHILRLPPDRPASVAMEWIPDGGERRGRIRKTGRQTFQEDLQETTVSWSSLKTNDESMRTSRHWACTVVQ